MKKYIPGLFSGFAVIFLAVLIGLNTVALNHSFYRELYSGLNLAEENDVSQEDINRSIDAMVDYVAGKRDDIEEAIVWKGHEQNAFNDKETAHMKDVKALYLRFAIVTGLLVLFTVILGWLCHKRHPERWLEYEALGIVQAFVCFAILLLVFGIMAMQDFTAFWTGFHKVFFTNDLWLLDPATDFMIVICPETMFSTLITRIVLAFLGITLPVLLVCLWIIKRKKTLYTS